MLFWRAFSRCHCVQRLLHACGMARDPFSIMQSLVVDGPLQYGAPGSGLKGSVDFRWLAGDVVFQDVALGADRSPTGLGQFGVEGSEG